MKLIIQYFMIRLESVAIVLLLGVVLTQNCQKPTYMISDSSLDGIFDTLFGALNYEASFRQFIANPNIDTLMTYLTKQAPYILPLWCLGGLSFVMLVGCCIQICCFNCCRTRKCGTKINFGSYSPSTVSCSVYLFFFFSLTLMALGVTTFILSADLKQSSTTTLCNLQNTFNYMFDGTPAGITPSWSGVNNFNKYASQVSTSFPNVIPTINNQLSSSNPVFTAATDSTSGSLYSNAIAAYACPTTLTSQTVACPFSDPSACPQSSATPSPLQFNIFCTSNNFASAAGKVKNEQVTNSTAWQTNLINLQTQISGAITTPIDFTNLNSKTSSLAGSISNYKLGGKTSIDIGISNIQNATIGTYVTLGCILLFGLLGFLSVFCVFCTRNFNCRFMLYPLWIIFSVSSILLFAISGALLFGSFSSFDACLAYNYYTTTPGALSTLTYGGDDITKILNNCFITNPNSNIFDTFSSTNLPKLSQIRQNYYNSIPAPTFSSIATDIENSLKNYYMNPNLINLVGATSTQSPQTAFTQGNTFANNNCGAVNDSLQYNPALCYPYLTSTTATKSACILLTNPSSTTVVNNRESSFFTTTPGCTTTTYTQYRNNFNALSVFGNNVQTIAGSFLADQGLNNYETAYFNYYEAVAAVINPTIQSLFASFITPYEQLTSGSSCNFVTTSLNSLVNTSCNSNFPYIYAVSILVIGMSCCFFFLMILSYFLTTRLDFYAYLNGDLTNYKQGYESEKGVELQMADMSNRQQLIKNK